MWGLTAAAAAAAAAVATSGKCLVVKQLIA